MEDSDGICKYTKIYSTIYHKRCSSCFPSALSILVFATFWHGVVIQARNQRVLKATDGIPDSSPMPKSKNDGHESVLHKQKFGELKIFLQPTHDSEQQHHELKLSKGFYNLIATIKYSKSVQLYQIPKRKTYKEHTASALYWAILRQKYISVVHFNMTMQEM